jgi:hypothetical protein
MYEYEYAYEIAKILLALWGGLSLTYGSLVIGLVVGSRCGLHPVLLTYT